MGRFTDARNKAKRGAKGHGSDDEAKTEQTDAQELEVSDESDVQGPDPTVETAADPEEMTSEAMDAETPADAKAEPGPSAEKSGTSLPPFGLAADILKAVDGETSSPAAPDAEDVSPQPDAEVPIPDVTGESEPLYATSDDPFAAITRDNGHDSEEEVQTDELRQLVTFFLGREEYALRIAEVQEINRVVEITRVPNAPGHVRGVINLRGRIIPVIELKQRLALGATALNGDSRIVVAEYGPKVLGLMVDRVSAVLTVRDSQIEQAPDEVVKEQRNYVKGVCKLDDRIIILLDLERLIGQGSGESQALAGGSS